MKKKLKLLCSLFLFLVFTSLVSYHVIGDTNTIKLQELKIELQKSLLDRLIDSSMVNSVKEFLMQDLSTDQVNSIRLFCIILTSEKNYKQKAQVIYDSWAYKCDEYRFITMMPSEIKNQSLDQSINLTNISIEFNYNKDLKFLQPADLIHDKYDELTDKMYHTFKDVYKRYGYYDWYLKADDDTFIFVDNLKQFLTDKNASKPVTYGYNFKVIVQKGYHSGGGGYVLSREALNRLGAKLVKNYKFCPNSGTEDVDVAKCLRKLDVYPGNSTDELGRERFHPLSVMGHYNGEFPDWMYSYASNPVKKGINCCSDTSISFHYMDLNEITKLSSIIENYKNNSSSSTSNRITFEEIIKQFRAK